MDGDASGMLDALMDTLHAHDLGSPNEDADPEAQAALVPRPEQERRAADRARLMQQCAEAAAQPRRPHQLQAFTTLRDATAGLYVLSGNAGAGKTHLLRAITHHHLSQGRDVMLSATTGIAAMQLSPHAAATVHAHYGVNTRGVGLLRDLPRTSPLLARLRHAAVHVIDEMSMMSVQLFSTVLLRLSAVHECQWHELPSKYLILLTGDHAQVRRTCRPGPARSPLPPPALLPRPCRCPRPPCASAPACTRSCRPCATTSRPRAQATASGATSAATSCGPTPPSCTS